MDFFARFLRVGNSSALFVSIYIFIPMKPLKLGDVRINNELDAWDHINAKGVPKRVSRLSVIASL